MSVRWPLLALSLTLLALAPVIAIAAPDEAAQASLDRSVRFLQDAQNLDGGFGANYGDPSDPTFSAWAAYALAAAGINPQDQAKPGGADVFAYLAAHTHVLEQTTDFDRVALVALASGTSPRSFGTVDPVGTILSRQLADGSFPQVPGGEGWINSTIWSVFPLSAVDGTEASAAVQRAADWLLGQQRPDGSWPSYSPASWSDADMTGAAIQALNAAGRHDTEAERRAFEYLGAAQREDGGFEATPAGGSNSAATAWVIQGMWAAGQSPRDWRTAAGSDPLAYLASLQRPDGSIGYTATSDLNSLWMTAQVGPALAGRAYPLPAVPRQVKAPPRATSQETPPAGKSPRAKRRGNGGFRFERGEGVIAGGGGRGAPFFSAPQPQSAGSTARGAREIESASSPTLSSAGLPEATSTRGSSQASGPGSARSGSSGEAEAGAVEGILVGGGEKPRAAPGLFGASAGGETEGPAILVGLLGLLLGAMALGARRERSAAVTI